MHQLHSCRKKPSFPSLFLSIEDNQCILRPTQHQTLSKAWEHRNGDECPQEVIDDTGAAKLLHKLLCALVDKVSAMVGPNR